MAQAARRRAWETAVSLNDLGSVLRLNGDLGAERSFGRRWRSTARPRRRSPNTATTLRSGAHRRGTGRLPSAESMLWRVLAIERGPSAKAPWSRRPSAPSRACCSNAGLRRGGLRCRRAEDRRPRAGPGHPLVAIYDQPRGRTLARKTPAATPPNSCCETAADPIALARHRPEPAARVRRQRLEHQRDQSLLGAALLAERRYDEAEAMLLDAERDLTSHPLQRELTVDPPPRRSLRAWGNTKAAECRTRLRS